VAEGAERSEATDELLGSIKNAARRWWTTVNFDLLVYRDRIVVARGYSHRDIRAHAKASRPASHSDLRLTDR
jgi:hypothetical protein